MSMTEESGEARLRRRRLAFWRFSLLGGAIAVVAALGLAHLANAAATGTASVVLTLLAIALGVSAYTWFSVAYFRRVDELDLVDNLWASHFATTALAIGYPAWLLLERAGLAPQAQASSMWMATFGALLIAYAIRKFINR
ncbi:hypothetical protein A6F68_02314 [Tsuneonella dongtanensis]|uniref:Uncharacterized protein n=1 Tax=Tsuneonella dongtanensis TaxID=692370 RepID=A0A1B2AF98_9SPHN|nr:hypothetical protein [Tsuneonella dongtanensis]ANY20814.1 hypothetical protein A6F68_02314 [Tsuneonella dongtanensis]